MAWIAKPSATTQIDRRDEPYLTDAMRTELTERYLPRFETTHAALLPALHMIQHEYHWVPKQAMAEIAEFLKIPPAEVLDTASFYEEYSLEPRGATVVAVCRSIACEACNYQKITRSMMDKLDIEVGETTADGKFTLVELECIGACGGAPACLIGEKLVEFATPENMAKAVDEASKSGH